jgi:hypothetical protein
MLLIVTIAFKPADKPVKCVHEFVRAEDSVIKIQKYEFDGQAGYYPVGRKNGPMLVCIKCYYKTPQVYDYGDVNKDISEKKTSGKNYH